MSGIRSEIDPITASTSFVAGKYPLASAAFVGGSILTEHRNATSDLDIVVIGVDDAPYRETLVDFGFTIEVFAHTIESLREYWQRDAARRATHLARMVGEGAVLISVDQLAEQLQDEARSLLAAGPAPLDQEEMLLLRYGLTDLLDDFVGSVRESEVAYLAASLLLATSERYLAFTGRWLAGGKALDRALRVADAAFADRLKAAHHAAIIDGDKEPLIAVTTEVLSLAGGPLLAGYRQSGHSKVQQATNE
jgi:hypothetical protein